MKTKSNEFCPQYYFVDENKNTFTIQLLGNKRCVIGLPSGYTTDGLVLVNLELIVTSGGYVIGMDDLYHIKQGDFLPMPNALSN